MRRFGVRIPVGAQNSNTMDTKQIIAQVAKLSTYSKSKSDAHGEVFTPGSLIKDMLRQLPKTVWSDMTKKWFDPCAGKGNFPAYVVHNLMTGLRTVIPDEDARYKHIVENMLYMSEYQQESAEAIERLFNPDGTFQLNLHVGDTLTMPEDFFDLPLAERTFKYPTRVVEPVSANTL